jgi:hypothetical protein
MAIFLRRFIGALALDASIYEDIEADRGAALQSLLVVVMAAVGGGVGVVGLGLTGVAGFMAGMVVVLGGWLLWITFTSALGTITMAEPQTRSSTSEVMRTVSFAMAPGVLLAFAALKPAAPAVIAIVLAWIIAGSVVAMRQALDYRSTGRAVAVCVASWLIAVGLVAAVAAMLTRRVS